MSRNPGRETTFRFKQFELRNERSAMKIGTDGVMLGGWVRIPSGACRVLDAGSGTGLIALMICQRNRSAKVTAVELDPVAETEGRGNISRSPFGDRIASVNVDFVRFKPMEKYDLIVSNPPFFTSRLQSPDNVRAVARHEGSLGIAMLLRYGRELLAPDGMVAFIAPHDRDEEVLFEAALLRYSCLRRCAVVTVEGKKPRRTLWQFSLKDTSCTDDSVITIRNAAGDFTPEYIDLLKDFYIKL